MSQPEPPVNAQLVYRDGSRVPVDLVYVGLQHGLHRWEVATPVDPERPLRGLTCDRLPGQTSIAFPFPARDSP